MATGTIKTIRDDRRFGFISPDDRSGKDVFFHRSAVKDDGFDQLQIGQKVEFDQERDPRDTTRLRATNVTPTDS